MEESFENEEEDTTQSARLYLWGGKYRRVPENFAFPDSSVLQTWQLWLCGNEAQGWPPLRFLETSDLSTKNLKRGTATYYS